MKQEEEQKEKQEEEHYHLVIIPPAGENIRKDPMKYRTGEAARKAAEQFNSQAPDHRAAVIPCQCRQQEEVQEEIQNPFLRLIDPDQPGEWFN